MHEPRETADRVEASLFVDDPIGRAVARAGLFGGASPKVGRFAIVRRIGAGGMGVVYEARDALLGRPVALKVLSGLADRREAKALARLSHANVVQVFDVGTHEDRFYIAMELVEGANLRHWQRDRSQAEILAAYCAAARGVAAAHAVGLLHRDLKPENVLMGRDGRPRVVDFGLAREWMHREGSSDEGGAPSPVHAASSRMGTPGYMAPEQLAGGPLDVRTDLFAFCVALFEALARVHPFLGTTARSAEDIDWARLPRTTPRAVRVALARGLARAPADRFASMDELIGALQRTPRRFALAGIGSAACLLTAASVVARPEQVAASPCAELEHASPFDDDVAARLGDAFARAQPGYGAASWTAVGPRLADAAAAWTSVRDEICDGSLSPSAMAVGVQCLANARGRMDAMIERLENADPVVIERAADLIDALASPGECLTLADASSASAPPRDPRAIAIDARIGPLYVRSRVGDDVSAEIDAVVADAEATGDAAAMVHAWLLRANDTGRRGLEWTIAEETRAYFAAVEAGLGPEAAFAATRVVQSCVAREDVACGDEWVAHAETAIARFELGEPMREALDQHRIELLLVAGRLDECEALLRNLAARLDARGDTSSLRGDLSESLGLLLTDRGRAPEAELVLREAYARKARMYGAGHPRLVASLNALSIALDMQGRGGQAEAALREALAIAEHVQPPTLNVLMTLHANLGNAIGDTRPEEGMEHLRESLRLAELAHAPPSQLAVIHHEIGNLARDAGDLDEAVAQFERERAMIESDQGADDPNVGHPLHALGRIHLMRDELDLAEPLLRRALELWTKAYGLDHPLVSFPLSSLGELELARHHEAKAIPLLRRAIALREANPGDPDKLAESRFLLARALWPTQSAHDEAIALATKARDTFAELGESQASKHALVIAWLQTHR
jgi:tetratricopeptide (TPR) repeat protein